MTISHRFIVMEWLELPGPIHRKGQPWLLYLSVCPWAFLPEAIHHFCLCRDPSGPRQHAVCELPTAMEGQSRTFSPCSAVGPSHLYHGCRFLCPMTSLAPPCDIHDPAMTARNWPRALGRLASKEHLVGKGIKDGPGTHFPR